MRVIHAVVILREVYVNIDLDNPISREHPDELKRFSLDNSRKLRLLANVRHLPCLLITTHEHSADKCSLK